MIKQFTLALSCCFILASQNVTNAASVLDHYQDKARQEIPNFDGFSIERGQAFYHANHATGKPDTPSCTSCHTKDPKQSGQTRAGKVIEPLAPSVSPDRFQDLRKVEKWFRRNCDSVLGRECSLLEKGDFLTFIQSQ